MFSTGEFFKHGILLSIILVAFIGLAILTFWPMLGMPVLMPKP
jgi:sodium-dependent dicarboxylate transporter 2/3/5